MPRATLPILLLTALLAACSDSNDDDDVEQMPPPAPTPPPANTTDFDAALTPAQVVGGGADTGSATSQLTVNLDDGTVSGTVTLTALDAEAVSLHQGFAGEQGPVLIELMEESAQEWAFPDGVGLSEQEVETLQTGGLYLEVTTADAPEGAVRGQLVPDDVEVLFVRLSGAQEVPPVETAATGMAGLTLGPDEGAVILHLNTQALDDAVEAHIHEAAAGVNGPILTGLVQDPDDAAHWLLEDFTLDQAGLDGFSAGRLYLNVHTPEHQPGEIRGQIEPEGVDVFLTTLTGDDVVPPVQTDASGVAAATLASQSQTLTLHVNLMGLDDAEAVNVRQAPVMQNGPVALDLAQDVNDIAHWSLVDVTLTEAQHQALLSQGLYVTVETPDLPEGEVRGQLVPDMSEPADGEAFVVTATTPDDGATVAALPPTVSASFSRDLLASSVTSEQISVTASGGDASFADGNEVGVAILGVTVEPAEVVAELDTNAASDDVYQLVLDGTSANPITDTAGVVLDGDGDGAPGGDYSATFTVDSGADAPTLSQLQSEVFTPSCAKSGCHAGPSPAQGMNLSAGQTFANTVDVPSAEVPSLDRVEPGNPDDSYLVRKIEGTASVGGRMPLDGPPFLTNAQIQSIRDWIAAGAEND